MEEIKKTDNPTPVMDYGLPDPKVTGESLNYTAGLATSCALGGLGALVLVLGLCIILLTLEKPRNEDLGKNVGWGCLLLVIGALILLGSRKAWMDSIRKRVAREMEGGFRQVARVGAGGRERAGEVVENRGLHFLIAIFCLLAGLICGGWCVMGTLEVIHLVNGVGERHWGWVTLGATGLVGLCFFVWRLIRSIWVVGGWS